MMNFILVPFYNEAENIPQFIKQVAEVLGELNFQFVCVNDGSTDNTFEVLSSLLPSYSLHIIHYEHNKGPGVAFQRGFEWILKEGNDNDRIITLEGDNTADLSTLKELIKASEQADLVLASVYALGGGFRKTNAWRLMISRIANALTRKVLRINQQTLTSFYRVWKFELINKMNQKYTPLIEESGFICQVELLVKATRCKARIVEIPTILYSERRKGKSKMKILKTGIQHFLFLLRTWRKLNNTHHK
jgi:dolichol-phosphate mannosyltransferase